MKRKTKYRTDYADKMRRHFSEIKVNAKGEFVSLPSFVSFAREIGITLGELEELRICHEDLALACEECMKMQKQLLIDAALAKKVDSSFAKYYLDNYFDRASVGNSSHPFEEYTSEELRIVENYGARMNNDDEG